MGACCSKTSTTVTSSPTPPQPKFNPTPPQPEKNKNNPTVSAIVAPVPVQEQPPKKESFIVKHRKSQETERNPDQLTRKSTDRKEKAANLSNLSNLSEISDPVVAVAGSSAGGHGDSGRVVGATVRTSSCTKEEVDAILIQCGRLSRSSSGVKPAGGETPTRGRRYSGSKRSFDFDMENGSKNDDDEATAAAAADGDHHRRRQQREHRVSSPSSRRRSRERDLQQQRSGSKERGTGSGTGGRRVSRSPNRRSESPNPNSNGASAASGGGVGGGVSGGNRPGKMVSVPATEKSNNAGGGEVVTTAGGGGAVKKIQVKRNAGDAAGHRTAASPRSRSPARTNLRVLNDQNPQLTLSRSNSRKAEHSPYRRNPLGEIDTNAASVPAATAAGTTGDQPKKQNCEKLVNSKPNNVKNCIPKESQMSDEIKIAVENPKQGQIVSRTRSSRLSRELDINPEALLNSGSSLNPPTYASLLLEDIQNFHHKNPAAAAAAPAAPPPAFTIPACVSKACSILEAVADLNSATSSNDRQFKKDNHLVESEKAVNDDLMEPSLHKYVTVRRGGGDADAEEQESSGSNSFAGSQQLSWMSSSWEPNSGDSTDRWSSNSRLNGQDTEARGDVADYPRNGIGRGRVGVHGRSAYSLPNTASTFAST